MWVNSVGMDQPVRYEIRVQGRLRLNLSDWFQGDSQQRFETRSEYSSVGSTVITGMVADQSALFGLLMQIRDLGLVLLSVRCLSALEQKSE